MPVRAVLNVAYALLMKGLDGKQRDEMDEQIYGWGAANDRANRMLRTAVDDPVDESGGEG